jgi:S-(hydroxymethyl)glutathione dehydrogenase/alcohol dehydrogenase
MSFVPMCGDCYHCLRDEAYLCLKLPRGGMHEDGSSRFYLGDTPLNTFMLLGNMAEQVVCSEINVVPVSKDVPLQVAALIGCGVTTGVGAVLNTAQVPAGATVAVFGCGGVGLACIQGARVAGASRIFAIDLSDTKLEMAKRFGATDVMRADDKTSKAIMKATGGIGVDYAFEAIGIGKVVGQALAATRRGGHTVAVGVGSFKDEIKLNALGFPLSNKHLSGCMFGSANPRVDFPKLAELHRTGQLDLAGMVTRTYTIDEGAQAFEDLKSGVNARGVIVFE